MTDTTSTANTIPVNDLGVGAQILYPHLTRTGCTDEPCTVSGIVEYPKTRVLYFAEGGYGVVDRGVAVKAVAR